jgi:transketolase
MEPATAQAPAPPAIPAPGDLDLLCINAIRILAMDAVQKADSGHPGTPMALAPIAYLLYTRHLRHDPADPAWPNRDRFVLSCGHASMLLYSSLYLSGYDLSLDDIKNFRQWGSKTPGHPEYGHTPGVETTTGPLGQGIGNAVGMALAETHLAAIFNRPDYEVIDHRTYFICSDGDLMEGVSHESASFAGHFKLGKLIGFYDDNHITIDGSTDLTFTDDTQRRFEAYGWHVLRVPDVNDLVALDAAIRAAQAETERPSLIMCRTHIGYGSPHKVDSAKAHGEALGVAEVALSRKELRWPWTEAFFVPPEAIAHWRLARDAGRDVHASWQMRYAAYQQAHTQTAAELDRRLRGVLRPDWDADIPVFTPENGNVASRAASGIVLNAIAARVPELIGGSADLTPSNNTSLAGILNYNPGDRAGRYLHFGIREHGMGAILNGMSVHGGLIPFGGTFLIFSDYMRPPIRLAALMRRRSIYVYTHDSVGLGEDGPTHQPIEQLTGLRSVPNNTVIRPADANETAEAWRYAMTHPDGPVALALSRQKLPFIDRTKYGSASGVARGAYVLADTPGGPPQVILLSSGSEVSIIIDAQTQLAAAGIRARTVSCPSLEIFARQPEEYRTGVLMAGIPRVAIEAAHPMSWYQWVGTDGTVIGLEHFGASAPFQKIYQEFGLTAAHVIEAVRALLPKR